MSTKDIILKQLADNPVIIYMKGVPTAPECGFSEKAVNILNETKVPFAYVNVLKAPFIRDRLPSVSKWPTFPQLFIKGELVGGADIVESMHNDGSLLSMLQAAVQKVDGEQQNNVITHSEVEALICKEFADAKIAIEGQGCDLTIRVVSERFTGLSMVKQHQAVMATLTEPLATGRLHAVTLKTFTPEQWQAEQSAANPGLLQIQV